MINDFLSFNLSTDLKELLLIKFMYYKFQFDDDDIQISSVFNHFLN